MKTQIGVRARDDAESTRLRTWLVEEFGPRCGASEMFVADIPDPFGNPAPPVFDALIESETAQAEVIANDSDLGSRVTLVRFTVESFIRKAELPRRAGVISPGAAIIAPWVARPDVDDSDIERHWTEHVPLALDVHHGAQRYVQNHVRAQLGGDKAYRGIAVLHFPVVETIPQDLFRSPDDVALIQEDVADFLVETDTFVAREYVYRIDKEELA